MSKEHGKKINDLGFYGFKLILQYYANQLGKNVHYIDKWFASTKICNHCGYKNDTLTIKDREWDCPQCNTCHDRDYNASDNIVDKGCEELNLNFNFKSFQSVRALTDRRESVRLDVSQAALATA